MKERIAEMDGYLNGYDATTEADQRHAYDVGFADAVRAASLAPVAQFNEGPGSPAQLEAGTRRIVDAAERAHEAIERRMFSDLHGQVAEEAAPSRVAPPSEPCPSTCCPTYSASPLPRATEPEAETPGRVITERLIANAAAAREARASSAPPVASQSQDVVMFDLRDALVELQSAAWSRSWKRVKAARAAVEAITGFSVPGPLVHSQEAPASGPSDERSET